MLQVPVELSVTRCHDNTALEYVGVKATKYESQTGNVPVSAKWLQGSGDARQKGKTEGPRSEVKIQPH